jgi:hypothetical protein
MPRVKKVDPTSETPKVDGRKTWRLKKMPKSIKSEANLRVVVQLLDMARELLANEIAQK